MVIQSSVCCCFCTICTHRTCSISSMSSSSISRSCICSPFSITWVSVCGSVTLCIIGTVVLWTPCSTEDLLRRSTSTTTSIFSVLLIPFQDEGSHITFQDVRSQTGLRSLIPIFQPGDSPIGERGCYSVEYDYPILNSSPPDPYSPMRRG